MQGELFGRQVRNQARDALKGCGIADELGQFLISPGPIIDFDAAITHAQSPWLNDGTPAGSLVAVSCWRHPNRFLR
jgi:hypothetical protein